LIQDERLDACKTNTQYIAMLSGYDWARKQLGETGSMNILDNACGSGYGSNYLSGFAGKVTGIDISEAAISICKNDYHKDNLSFYRMDGAKLSFVDNCFDAVISQDTLEHVEADGAFISEIHRVLKPGGKLVIFTPYSPVHNPKPKNIYHVREYSRDTFLTLLNSRFNDVRIYGRILGKELSALEDNLASVRKYDTLGLRALVPRAVRHIIANIIAKVKGNISLDEVSFEHIEYTDVLGDKVTTMVAVCSKA
jgi:SAM-dependent methyltransferase